MDLRQQILHLPGASAVSVSPKPGTRLNVDLNQKEYLEAENEVKNWAIHLIDSFRCSVSPNCLTFCFALAGQTLLTEGEMA